MAQSILPGYLVGGSNETPFAPFVDFTGRWFSSFELGFAFADACLSFASVTLPELIAQTNLGPQATNRLREELSKFSMWLSKTSDQFFTRRYQSASNQYIEKASGIVDPIAPGTATARLS